MSLPKKIPVLGREKALVTPINIREGLHPDFYELFNDPQELGNKILQDVDWALQMMITNGLTKVRDRKAVWFNAEIYLGEERVVLLTRRLGSTFPVDPQTFEKDCKTFCKEKVKRTHDFGVTCSHENRDPKNKKFGGSVRLVFRLISKSGEVRIFTIILAPSGLKEWEDLALGLAAFYRRGLIINNDEQVREILAIADASVAGQEGFSPDNSTIAEYVREVFKAAMP